MFLFTGLLRKKEPFSAFISSCCFVCKWCVIMSAPFSLWYNTFMAVGDIKYEVECLGCTRKFRVADINSLLPKHPPKGEKTLPGVPYVPCIGSDTIGIPIKAVVEGSE
jgi:hypothetical protein